MAVTELKEVVEPNWLSRMGSSFKGVVTGLVLFVAGFPFLFWNEGRAVATAKSLDEGRGCAVELASPAVDPANEGKLVYASGKAETSETLIDPVFGVSVANGIRLQRKTEIFQWVENSHTRRIEKDGKKYDETTYTYTRKWTASPVDSSSFKESGHDNPPVFSYPDEKFQAQDVTLGEFRLPEKSISRIGGTMKLRLPQDFTPPASIQGAQVAGDAIYVPAPVVAPAMPSIVSDPTLAVTAAVAVVSARQVAVNPAVGDQRVTFTQVLPHDISIAAKQMGDTFADWISSNQRSVNLQDNGIVSLDQLFADAQSANTTMTWILRLVGFLAMYFGIQMLFGPLTTLVDKIPLVNWLVGSLASLTAFVIAAVCALVTIAIAWFVYRPVLGCLLLAAAIALIVFIVKCKRAKKALAVQPAQG